MAIDTETADALVLAFKDAGFQDTFAALRAVGRHGEPHVKIAGNVFHTLAHPDLNEVAFIRTTEGGSLVGHFHAGDKDPALQNGRQFLAAVPAQGIQPLPAGL